MLQLVLCCLYVLLFVFIIYKNAFFRLPGLSPQSTILLFLLKVLTGTLLWKVFVSYYPTSDATVFFKDSELLYETFWEQPVQFFRLLFGILDDPALQPIQAKMTGWSNAPDAFLINDSRTLIRLNALFRFGSFGYFYIHAIIMCFLSFTGLVYLYKLFFPYLRNLYILLIIALFLSPSVLFWSSAVLKEGLLFLGLGMMLYHCQCGLRNQYSYKNCIGLVLGTAILVLVKIYVLFALLPALLANFWIACSNHKYIVVKYIASYSLFTLFLLFARSISPVLDVATILKDKQTNFMNMAKGGMLLQHDSSYVYLDYNQKNYLEYAGNQKYKLKKGYRYISFRHIADTVWIDGAADTANYTLLYAIAPSTSAFAIEKIRPSFVDILKRFPFAFFNTLAIPALFSLDKTFSGLLLVQNMLLLLFMLCILVFFVRKQVPLAITLFCFSFVCILFSLIGITTPVLGALVRYRIPGIPFLIIGFSLIADERKIMNVIQGFKGNLFKKLPYFKK